jgi:LacI family transcriptional regulator
VRAALPVPHQCRDRVRPDRVRGGRTARPPDGRTRAAYRSAPLPPHGLVVRESTDFFAVEHELVAAALAYISANSHRRIGPDDVARAVEAETRTLQNYFRKTLRRPIATEIRRVRIERAKRELAQGQRSLAAIARDVGFGNSKRLYEVFHRELGVSPDAFRRQRQLKTSK